MRKIILHAKKLANQTNHRMSTLHLLLSIMIKGGPAANLLQNVGLNESKIRAAIREGGTESEGSLKRVLAKAESIARSFRVVEPSAMHLLVGMLSQRNAALMVIEQQTDNVYGLKGQALRSCTRTVNAFAEDPQRSLPLGCDYSVALPLPAGLDDFSVTRDRSVEGKMSESRPARVKVPPARPIRLDAFRDMGSEIEQKQRARHQAENRNGAAAVSGVPSPTAAGATAMPSENVSPAAPVALAPDAFPLLSGLGRNLVDEAAAGRIEAIVGREKEMEQLADVLNKRRANCPLVVGAAGVGKTALVEGLAERLVRGCAPGIDGAAIIEVRAADLLAGTSVRGALSERLEQLKQEVAKAEGSVILFFDEIHSLLSTNDGTEAIQELKNSLGRGELPCIAVTGEDEYTKYIEADPALMRRFTKVDLPEPTEKEAIDILRGVIPVYSDHHGVEFAEEAVQAAVKLSARYIVDRALPDKAISLIDTAGARVRRRGELGVTAEDIARVVAKQLGIPAERLIESDHARLLNLESSLAEEIVGHGHVLSALGETLRRNAAGFRSGRPIGTFLFLGPTGVGKTETAKALGDFLFPNKGAFIRLDMSEFSEAHAVARLVGAPPGYVGHEEGGQLTEAVRRRPYSLVLLDEIEKAHPDVLQVLLQVLDDGRLTDGLGRTIVFENTIIVLTSNLGCALRQEKRRVGFGAKREVEELSSIRDNVLGAVRESLPPELWNRLDELLVFEPLTRKAVLEIAARMIAKVGRQLRNEKEIGLVLGDGLLETLADVGGYDPEFGARPMRRTIQRLVEGPVARLVLEGRATAGDAIVGFGDNGEIAFEILPGESVQSAVH